MRGLFTKHPAAQSQQAPKPISHAIPSSALTRWLRQGIELGICPLCRVSHKADREYIWAFSEEGFGDEQEANRVARARGFCAPHTEMLTKIDIGVRSMLGCSTIYVDLFEQLDRELSRLGTRDRFGSEQCPACHSRDAALRRNAEYLLALLDAAAGTIAERYPASPGLCFPHFELVWATGGSDRARRTLLDVQRRAVAEIHRDLLEFIRKEGAEARHEPRGAEQDAWLRAEQLTAGWPPPAESAGVPEQDAFKH